MNSCAQRMKATPEEVKEGLDDYDSSESKRERTYPDDQLCGHCCNRFFMKSQRIQSAGNVYHPECWRKFSIGA